jgi:3-hydroxybutyrate dehydrogenase
MLKGKTALVTGSTSGIGLAIAQGLADAGANVVLNGLGDAAAIEAARKDVESRGVKCTYDGANLMDPAAIQAMFTRIGPIDILVNNAGIQHVAAVQDFPDEKWNAIIALNLSAVFHCSKLALPHMLEKGWGRVVNIASAHGLSASPYKSAYVAAKHGVVGFTKTLGLETAEKGITCNAVCPGYVLTPIVEGQIGDQMKVHGKSRDEVIRDIMLARQPTKKFVTVEEVAATTVFLCSPGAASITGTTISVDGGWTAL